METVWARPVEMVGHCPCHQPGFQPSVFEASPHTQMQSQGQWLMPRQGNRFMGYQAQFSQRGNGPENGPRHLRFQNFHVRIHCELRGNQKREKFHKIVAQCLYVVTRTRPDASLPVIFLTTRVLEKEIKVFLFIMFLSFQH